MSTAGRAERGFTLLELLVVLVVMGLVIGLAVPRFRSWRDPGLRQVASALAGDLRAQRVGALRTGRIVGVRTEAYLDRVPTGMRLTGVPAEGLVFYPDGRTSGAVWRVEDASGIATLEVDWLTGSVRVTP